MVDAIVQLRADLATEKAAREVLIEDNARLRKDMEERAKILNLRTAGVRKYWEDFHAGKVTRKPWTRRAK